MKIPPPVGSVFFDADGWIDRRSDRGEHDKANSRCPQFCERAENIRIVTVVLCVVVKVMTSHVSALRLVNLIYRRVSEEV
jgi:hypothetical protein